MAARLLVVAGLFLCLICAVFAEENWRGKRDWERCRRALEEKGALDWKQYVPPAVPDEQNFAATPFLAPLFDFEREAGGSGPPRWRDKEGHDRAANFAAVLLPTNNKGELPPARLDGSFTDLEASLQLLRGQSNGPAQPLATNASRTEVATELLATLTAREPVLEELRSASRRPHSRFNIEYDAQDPISILLPHYIVLHRLTRLLEVRASAELVLNRTDAAFEDVQFMLRLANSTQDEPFLMGVASRGSRIKRTEQIIWEGLAGRKWSETQLKQFERAIGGFRPLKEMDRAMRAERAAFGDITFRYIRTHKNVLRMWLGSEEAAPLAYLLMGPNGWLYEEQVTYHRLYDRHVLMGLDPVAETIQPRVIDANRDELERELKQSVVWYHTGFSRLIFSNLMKIFQRTAVEEDRAHQVVAACALERFRLANGSYPETLEQLVPLFVEKAPVDVCDGQPLRYRRVRDREFLLYSVGWDQKDDGGTRLMASEGSNMVPKEGDWVWPPYPGN